MAPMHLSKMPREDFILKPVVMLCKAFVKFPLNQPGNSMGYLMHKGSQFEILHSRMHNQRLHGSGEYLSMSHLPAAGPSLGDDLAQYKIGPAPSLLKVKVKVSTSTISSAI